MRNNKIYHKDIDEIVNLSLPWEKLRNKTILISGATGMIGTVIIDVIMTRNYRFNDNINTIAVARNNDFARERFCDYFENSNFLFVSHDINLPFDLELGNIDYIIHAASNTHPIQYSTDPIGTIITNVIGTENLWKLAVNTKSKRFMFLSSVEIYGENRGDIERFSEEDLGYIDCNTVRAGYPEGKRVAEALCRAFSDKYGIETVTARLSRIYGPTMLKSDSKAIAQFIKNVVNGENIVLKSTGNQKYSFSYVFDAVSAIFTILLCGENGRAYNVADMRSDITLRELAEIIADFSGREVEFDLPTEIEKKGYSKVTKALLDSSELKKLGWKCSNSIEDGIKKTIKILKE